MNRTADRDSSGRTIIVALTGASGMAYGLRLLECLLAAGERVCLLYSQAAHIVAKQELDLTLPPRAVDAERLFSERHQAAPGQLRVYGREDWYSPVASGSNAADAMVICPCSMGTLAAVAAGLSDNLIERAADVMLKERRRLVLAVRETPLNLAHLRNMASVTEMGGIIFPPVPAFYLRPDSIEALIDHSCARMLDLIGVAQPYAPKWTGLRPPSNGESE